MLITVHHHQQSFTIIQHHLQSNIYYVSYIHVQGPCVQGLHSMTCCIIHPLYLLFNVHKQIDRQTDRQGSSTVDIPSIHPILTRPWISWIYIYSPYVYDLLLGIGPKNSHGLAGPRLLWPMLGSHYWRSQGRRAGQWLRSRWRSTLSGRLRTRDLSCEKLEI